VERQENQVQTVEEFTARSLSLAQAREALGVSRRTLYYWIKRGRLQTRRTPMGSQRVLVESVKAGSLQRH
jgi:excisionase family DNA binding protein